ncbi:protein NETWORKED 4B [Lactuca sativa]|nr:protein NETWORKED 4B [Lactuca sativa]
MEGVESKSQSQGWDTQIMAENVEGFQQCVKEILDLIKQDETFSEITAEIYDCKKLNLTKLVTELSRMHGELADHLIKEVNKNTHKFTTPIKIKTQQVDSSSSTSPQVTESSKKHEFKTPADFEFTFSSGGGFQISRSECSESSILKSSNSASASESIMCINKRLVSPVNDDALKVKETKVDDAEELLKNISVLEEELSNSNKKVQSLKDENALLETKVHDTEEVMKRISLLEEELSTWNKKVQSLEDENALLETKVHDTEELLKNISVLEEELSTSSKKAQSLLEDKNALLEVEKAKVAESTRRIETMGKVIEVYRTQVLTTDNEISKLKQELARKDIDQTQFLSLGQTITSLQQQLDSKQVRNDELHEKAIRFTADISKRDDEIIELSTKINQMRTVHAAEEDKLKTDITRLETEVREKCELVDDLNREHDAAVISCTDELKVKVVELEKEVEVVSEEKREAIRQLSFAVDHYMSAYKQLHQDFVSLNRRFV